MATPAKQWVTAMSLLALAQHGIKTGAEFSSTQLKEWTGLKKAQVQNVTETLIAWGFVKAARKVDESQVLIGFYTVTKEGSAAIEAAAQGQTHKSGPKGQHRKDRAIAPDTLAARLWKLMRQKQILDSEVAISTLVDAGDPEAFKRTQRTASKYFLRWQKVGAIGISKQRSGSGCKKYVLLRDSMEPPAWTAKAQARREKEHSQ